jgi:phage tail sheath protein FI
MANFISPGVYTIEKDVSDYAPTVSPSIVGLVGFASQGPTDTPTLLTSPANLLRTFGTPDLVTGGQGIYGALEILQKTNQVYFVRAATTSASSSKGNGQLAVCPNMRVAVDNMNHNLVYRFDTRTFDAQGAQYGETSQSYAYRERPYVSGTQDNFMPTTPAADWSTNDWNNAIAAGVGDVFDAQTGNVGYIPSGAGGTSGLFTARIPGATATTTSRLETTIYYSSGVSAAGSYEGTYLSATPIDVTDLTFYKAADSLVSVAADIGTTAFNVLAAPSGTNDTYLTASSVLTGANNLAASGISFYTSGAPGAYLLESLHTGLGYNYSAINYKGGLQYRGLQASINNFVDGTFALNIADGGGTEETYTMQMTKPTSTVSAISLFPEAVLNKGTDNAVSHYVKGNFYKFNDSTFPVSGTVSAVTTWTAPTSWGGNFNFGTMATSNKVTLIQGGNATIPTNMPVPSTKTNFRAVTLVQDHKDFSQGNNGDASDYGGNMSNATVRAAIIGNTGNKSGLYALDQEDVPVTIAAVPGVTDQNVQNSLISLAESTQNFLGVVSPPVGFRSAQQAIQWTNGKATGRTAAINSSYGSVYWPWVKMFDGFTGKDLWMDPSIFAIGQMCYTDEVADPWFAPAGLRRGRLTKPVDVEVKLNQGDRDALYGPGNIVNPITKFTSDGIVIYGQRTAQRAATALDRINVRRMMIFLRRLVLQSTRRFVFEPNDPITWEQIRNILSPALGDIQQRRGITAYKVVCDETTNTPLRIDRNELWCKVIIKPTKTAEMLIFELNLTNQSASV